MKLPSINAIKVKVYKFMIQPTTRWHVLYHLTILGLVLLTLLLYTFLTMNLNTTNVNTNQNTNNTTTTNNNSAFNSNEIFIVQNGQDENGDSSMLLYETVFAMEIFLSMFFLAEFMLRLWACGVCQQYKGFKGRMKFLRQFTCVVDIVVLSATVGILIVGFRQNDNFYASSALLRNLRFMQTLRLLHVDRHFSTWKLMAKVLRLHRTELIAAGYLALLGLLFMTSLVYWTETYHVNEKGEKTSVFRNFGDAVWWGFVTLTTIGYGDIAPKFWLSKVVTSVFALACVSLFTLTSSVIGVGLALMVQDQSRQRQAQKQTTAAACVLQTFWRQRLLAGRNFDRISYYRYDLTYKLRAHEMTPYISDVSANGQQQQNLQLHEHHKASSPAMFTFMNVMKSRLTTAGALAGLSLTSMAHGHQRSVGGQQKRRRESLHRSASVDNLNEHEHRNSNTTTHKTLNAVHRTIINENSVKDIFKPLSPQCKNAVEVKICITPAHDSDVNVTFSVDTPLLSNGRRPPVEILDSSGESPERGTPSSVPRRYKYALKAIWRMKFMAAKKRFKLSRKQYDLNDMSEEVSHSEAMHLYGIRKAHNKLERLAGKPTFSLLTDRQKELGLMPRLELVESKMAELDKKADLILQMATQLSDRIVRQQEKQKHEKEQLLMPKTTDPNLLTVSDNNGAAVVL